VDLLLREGYAAITPIGGTHDNGRDAMALYRGRDATERVTVFQFSKQEGWERKLRSDTDKIAQQSEGVTALVFVTSRSVTGAKQAKLAREFKTERGWDLTIHGREWLRLRLEEVHTDLARKYLGLELPETVCSVMQRLEQLSFLGHHADQELFREKSPDLVRATTIEATRREPGVSKHWVRLSAIEGYRLDFRAALASINRARDLEPKDPNIEQRYAAILAELGIETDSKPLLIQARDIFARMARILGRATDHYNLANVLGPLGELTQAEVHYLACLEKAPTAQCWKNLGSVYTQQNRLDKAMACFDAALKLDPTLVEAHISKGMAWLLETGDPAKAIACFEQAYALNSNLDHRWRHARYWHARALSLADRHEDALRQVDLGLRDHADDVHLLGLKAGILGHLWPRNAGYVERAWEFLVFRAQCFPRDCPTLVELLKLSRHCGREDAAWGYLDLNLGVAPFSMRTLSRIAGLSVDEWIVGLEAASLYKRFRTHSRVDEHGITLNQKGGLEPNPALIAPLYFALMVPFGRVANALRDQPEGTKPADPADVFSVLLPEVARIFTALGPQWLGEDKPADQKEQVHRLTTGILLLPDIIVAEAARIIGFLAGNFGISVEGMYDREELWREFHGDVAAMLLEQVDATWKMTKDAQRAADAAKTEAREQPDA